MQQNLQQQRLISSAGIVSRSRPKVHLTNASQQRLYASCLVRNVILLHRPGNLAFFLLSFSVSSDARATSLLSLAFLACRDCLLRSRAFLVSSNHWSRHDAPGIFALFACEARFGRISAICPLSTPLGLDLTPNEDFSCPIHALDFATPAPFTESLVKLATSEAVLKVRPKNDKCLEELCLGWTKRDYIIRSESQ